MDAIQFPAKAFFSDGGDPVSPLWLLGMIIIPFFFPEDLKQSYQAFPHLHPLYLSLRTHINPTALT